MLTQMADTQRTPLYTEYRIVAEHYHMSSISSRPFLYIYPTRYNTHDEAIGVVANALHSGLAVHNNNPADPQYEFIGDEFVTEVFYRKPDGEKVIDIKYRICPIEAFEHLTDDKTPRYYNSYNYRGYAINENVLRNRFSVQINGHKITKHKLNTLLDYIDGCILETEN